MFAHNALEWMCISTSDGRQLLLRTSKMNDDHDDSCANLFWCDLPEAHRLSMAECPESIRHWYLSVYSDPSNREALLPGFDSPLVVSIFVVAAEVAECEYVGLSYLFSTCRDRGFLFREVSDALCVLANHGEVVFFRSQTQKTFAAFKRLRNLLPTIESNDAIADAAREMELAEESQSSGDSESVTLHGCSN